MQILVRMCFVLNDLFVDLLGVAVWRERFLDRSSLINRQMVFVWLTIHGTRRREYEVWYLMQTHHIQQGTKTAKVVTIVQKRFLNRLTYCFAGSKMNDSDDIGILTEHIIEIYEVTAVDVRELRFAPDDSCDTVQHIDG